MSLTAGIVGLPNVGKSTLFNAITQSKVLAENYPFATIDPNVGVVEVPDARLDKLCEIWNPKSRVATTFEFTDIAGLVKGASQGEGLGNQFLANIRQTDAICQVVRCFNDPGVTHVEGTVDPIRDIEIINLELALADLSSMENRKAKIERKAQSHEKGAQEELNLVNKIIDVLKEGKPARVLDFTKEEKIVVKGYQLLTSKPMIYVANISEDDVADPDANTFYQQVKAYAEKEGGECIPICAKVEEDLATLEPEERKAFLEDLGIDQAGLDRVIRAAYHILGLKTFFTVGEKECRAWTFKDGMKAPECAGIIHTDFQRGFIRAETYHYEDLLQYGSEKALKDAGKLRSEGKEYTVKDGDIMEFRFNV